MEEKKKLQRAHSKKFSNKKKTHNNKGVVVEKNTKRGWSDIFDKLNYSNGPADNIYVFG